MSDTDRQSPTALVEGVLYVVATPIGHLGDVSQRALSVLREVDLVLAEDTRRSRRLLAHFGIDTPLRACHEHNEARSIPGILRRLAHGEQLALISDAGTPALSDPGQRLVCAVLERGFRLVPVPGASALTCALSVAGLPAERFVFEGFLPAKAEARRERLRALGTETRTVVFFEAPHRIVAMLTDLVAHFGSQRRATMGRELTKVFESVVGGSLGDLLDRLRGAPQEQRGEFVVVVQGSTQDTNAGSNVTDEAMLRGLLEELPLKQAVRLAAKISRRPRNQLYRQALEIARPPGWPPPDPPRDREGDR